MNFIQTVKSKSASVGIEKARHHFSSCDTGRFKRCIAYLALEFIELKLDSIGCMACILSNLDSYFREGNIFSKLYLKLMGHALPTRSTLVRSGVWKSRSLEQAWNDNFTPISKHL